MHSILDDYLSDLNEAKRTSTHRTTRNTKIKRATGQLATSAARKKNDPLYKNIEWRRIKMKIISWRYKCIEVEIRSVSFWS